MSTSTENNSSVTVQRSNQDDILVKSLKKQVIELGKQLAKSHSQNDSLTGVVLHLSRRFQEYQAESCRVQEYQPGSSGREEKDNYSLITDEEIINNSNNNPVWHLLRENELRKKNNECERLEKKLEELRIANEELEQEKNFHVAKSSELLQFFATIEMDDDKIKEELYNKSIQCAETTSKLHEMEDELTKSKLIIDRLEKEKNNLLAVAASQSITRRSKSDNTFNSEEKEENKKDEIMISKQTVNSRPRPNGNGCNVSVSSLYSLHDLNGRLENFHGEKQQNIPIGTLIEM